jgi:hypothetical protein
MLVNQGKEMEMMKWWIIGGSVVAASLLARRCASESGAFNWEKILERMPDTAPPKRILTDLRAIRENTDRILERLEGQSAPERS